VKILFIGDIFGQPGRKAVALCLDAVIAEHAVDLVVANAENAAGGFGLTRDIARELRSHGADVLTGGNHTFDKAEILPVLDEDERVLRPHNFPPGTPGSGVAIVDRDGIRVAIVNLMGRVFMPQLVDCPFQAADRILTDLHDQADVVCVDFHAEASSEKQALAWHLDGRVAALVGSHTHVQTADGMAYLTDLGMTGPHRGVIGVLAEQSLQRFLTGRSQRMEPARGDIRFHGAVVDIDPATGRAREIRRVQRRLGDV
jgi:metallophosphoesterase (TIGR00282 family)